MRKLVCPLCGAHTSPTLTKFNAKVRIRPSVILSLDEQDATAVRDGTAFACTPVESGQPTYGIMVCQACNKRFVAKQDVSGDWTAVYPVLHRTVAKDIPEPIRSEFEEALLCFAVDAYRACVSMCETALEALWRSKKVSGLNEFKDKGLISSTLFDQATEVRLWANVAKHKLADKVIAKEDAGQLLGYLEAILDAVYVQPARFAALKQKREQKLGKAPSEQ